ncbi:MAG TPA: cysteine desulfurase family protein [bacterium]|nr:cysteine desulfurase family protein [bacterium]
MDKRRLIYLDNNATTPCDPRVVEAMVPYFFEKHGNAASRSHQYGWEAEEAVDYAREQIAQLLGAEDKEIIFTSGATESNNLALKGVFEMYARKGNHIITAETEHKAILDTCKHLEKQGAEITYLKVKEDGLVDLAELEAAIRPTTILVTIMWANNETGVIQPMREIAMICEKHGVLFHSDATQAVGKIPTNPRETGIHLMSFTSHKMYGPKGVGCLYIRRGVKIPSFIEGGSQERGQRAGTENVPGIVGFGKAAEICKDSMSGESERLNKLMTVFWKTLQDIAPQARLNGHPEKRLPGHFNISFPGIGGDEIAMMLDLEGISVSTGSACTSGAVSGSHVLKAMGLGPEFYGSAVRFTFGRLNSEQDIPSVMKALQRIVEKNKNASIL